jgi:hypothetical protein
MKLTEENVRELNKLSEQHLIAMLDLHEKITAAHKALGELVPTINTSVKVSKELSLYLAGLLASIEPPQ